MVIYSPVISGSLTISGSILTTGGGLPLTGSLVSSGSFTSIGATVVSGSFTVITGSSIELQVLDTGVRIGNIVSDNHNVTGSLLVSGSITTVGTITAQTLVVQTVTSSVSFITGSTRFGVLASNTHQFTGSVLVSGSLGIGTASPVSNLHINETSSSITLSKTVSALSSSVGAIEWRNNHASTGVVWARIDAVTLGTTANPWDYSNITFSTWNGFNSLTERMRITNTGNVGIGTSAPTNTLTLQNTGENSLEFHRSNVMRGMLGVPSASNQIIQGSVLNDFCIRSTTNLLFSTGGDTERMRITSTGNIGINTTTIDQRFVINQGTANAFNQGIPATSGTTQNGILRLRPSTSFFGETLDFGMNVATTYAWIQATNTGNLAVNYNLALNPNGGNVGIGTTNPVENLQVTGNIRVSNRYYINDGTNTLELGANYIQAYLNAGASSTNLAFYTGTAERMRITSGGNVLVGTTANDFGSRQVNNSATSYTYHSVRTGTGSEGHLVFSNANGAVGSIFTNGSSTSYNTSSDYRLKQDLKDFNGLSLISSIKTYDYEWKADNTRAFGVIAHELAEVLPYAVSGEKDGEMMQGVDYSKIVPILVKAIQEQQAQIEALKSENDTLKEILQRNNIQ